MTNLSQQRREEMLAYLDKLRDLHGDDESLRIINQIQSEINDKRYGLIWEEHSEQMDEMLESNIPVFVDVPKRTIVSDKSKKFNFLLEGDNLHSLHLLQKTHFGKIDLIYIDPPYNTGSKDFYYDDAYVNSTDSYSHSKWLSFIKRRLEIASTLLSKDGIIFISIDDKEQAQLKLLCNTIFGENNFVGTIIQNKLNTQNQNANLERNHEYIHVYRKTISQDNVYLLTKSQVKKKEVFKEGDRYYYIVGPITTRAMTSGTLNLRPNLGYTVYYNPETKDIQAKIDYDTELARTSNDYEQLYSHDQELISQGYYPIIPPQVRGKLGCWTWGLSKFVTEIDSIVITGKAPKFAVNKRIFVDNELITEENGKFYYIFTDTVCSKSIIEYSTNDGSTVLKKILGVKDTFNNPKNLEMIKYLISLYNRGKDYTVLDFFAGSGTTGHAVAELNKEDGGNRTYILCTNNENNICEEVTYQRLSKIQEELPHNLRYYRTDFVAKFNSEDEDHSVTDATLKNIRELIELEHQTYIDGINNALLLDNDDIQYVLMNVADGANVYASSWIFFGAEDFQLIEEKGLNMITIPNYYFEGELIEVGEC